MKQSNDVVIVYTDGGCDPNPGIGGWGVVMRFEENTKELSGGEADSTNNRMELTAAIEALASLRRSCKIVMHTDSEYVKKGITEWMPGWRRNNWRRKGGALKNVDLWKRLDELVGNHEIAWEWVPAHTGIEDNERCDELATMEIAKLRDGQWS